MIKRSYLLAAAVFIGCSMQSKLHALTKLEMDLLEGAEQGDQAMVKAAIKAKVNVDVQDSAGRTPLLYAAKNGYTEIVQLLIDQDADLNKPQVDGWTPLMWAAYRGNRGSIVALLEAGANRHLISDDAQATRDLLSRQGVPTGNIQEIVNERAGKTFGSILRRSHPELLEDSAIKQLMRSN